MGALLRRGGQVVEFKTRKAKKIPLSELGWVGELYFLVEYYFRIVNIEIENRKSIGLLFTLGLKMFGPGGLFMK